MFETFDSTADVSSARRFALSTTASIGVFVLIGVAAVSAANKVREVIAEKKSVDVVFRPPPPPVVEVKPPPPPKPKLLQLRVHSSGTGEVLSSREHMSYYKDRENNSPKPGRRSPPEDP